MRILWCIQIVLLLLFAVAIGRLCLPRWEIDDQHLNILYTDEAGSQNRAVPTYRQLPLLPFGEDKIVGRTAINRMYINSLLKNVSNAYVHTYDYTKTEITCTVLSKSNNHFCYRISGAENGAYWEVWVTMNAHGTPNAAVYKSEGNV